MKFYKSLGLLAAAAGLLMTGCGASDGPTSDKAIVKAAASTDALIVSGSGTSYASGRTNELAYNKFALNLANTMGAEAKVVDPTTGSLKNDFVLTTVTWTLSGEGASKWKHNSAFDDKANDYQYWDAQAFEGTEKVKVTFTATITYGKASTKVNYDFLMCPKPAK